MLTLFKSLNVPSIELLFISANDQLERPMKSLGPIAVFPANISKRCQFLIKINVEASHKKIIKEYFCVFASQSKNFVFLIFAGNTDPTVT